jgi:hypothetical protein
MSYSTNDQTFIGASYPWGSELLSAGNVRNNSSVPGRTVKDALDSISAGGGGGGGLPAADGTAAAPSISFTSDSNTGLFRSAADNLGISTNGVSRVNISNTTTRVQNNLTVDGFGTIPQLGTNVVNFDALGSSIQQNGTLVANLEADRVDFDMPIALKGLTLEPSLRFVNDPLSGLARPESPEIGVSVFANGTRAFDVLGTEVKSNVQLTVPAFKYVGATAGQVLVSDASGVLTPQAPSGGASFPLRGPDGSLTAPSYSFTSSTNSGMFLTPGGLLGFSDGGITQLTVDSASPGTVSVSNRLLVGTQTVCSTVGSLAPAYSFTGDLTSGFFSAGANLVGLATAGVDRLTASTTQIQTTVPIRTPDGTATTPGQSFNGETNMGLFRSSANNLSVATNGFERLRITGGLVNTAQVLNQNGTAALPAYSFIGDPNTGIFQTGTADTMGFSTGGTVRLTLNTTGLTTPAGTAALPGINFTGSTTTGFSTPTATPNELVFSTTAVERLRLTGTVLTSTVPIRLPIGTAALPSMVLNSADTNTGFFQATAALDTISASCGGVRSMHLAPTNTSLGTGSGTNITTAAQSITIGNSAGLTITNNDGNVCIGTFSDVGAGVANATALGRGAIAGVSEGLFVRSSLAIVPAPGIPVRFDSATGQMGPESSSIRYKTDVQLARMETSSEGLTPFDQIRVVEYVEKASESDAKVLGIIAEELAPLVHPSLIPKDEAGDPVAIDYARLTCLLIQQVQELRREVAILKGKPLPALPAYVPVDEAQIYTPEKRFCEKLAAQKRQNCDLKQELRAERVFQEIERLPETKEAKLAELCESLKVRVEAKITQKETRLAQAAAAEAERVRLAEEAAAQAAQEAPSE